MASQTRDNWNSCRYDTDKGERGHYESWFQRANHPTRPLAFWIRYTIFSPARNKSADRSNTMAPEGELWAVFFDGESNTITAVKEEFPLSDCAFSSSGLSHRIGPSELDADSLRGQASGQGHSFKWNLNYTSPEAPLLFLPQNLYETKLPAAKSVVGSPLARFSGTLEIDGESVSIDNWVGSQNHNWGAKHTDEYAWGQVAGFDGRPDIFLEVITARVRLGPKPLGLHSPWMTLATLRIDGEEFRFNSILQSLRAQGHYEQFSWAFRSQTRECSIRGTIAASPNAFVALPYRNPPGGQKLCLNSKIATCHLNIERPGHANQTLIANRRSAFEILSNENPFDVPVLVP